MTDEAKDDTAEQGDVEVNTGGGDATVTQEAPTRSRRPRSRSRSPTPRSAQPALWRVRAGGLRAARSSSEKMFKLPIVSTQTPKPRSLYYGQAAGSPGRGGLGG